MTTTGKSRILVVDDEALVRKVLVRILARQGYEVEEAETAVDARQRLQSRGGGYGLLVTDLGLPDGDGLDLARWTRQVRPNCGVLLTTGSIHDVDAGELGPVLRKPFDVTTLMGAVDAALAPSSPA